MKYFRLHSLNSNFETSSVWSFKLICPHNRFLQVPNILKLISNQPIVVFFKELLFLGFKRQITKSNQIRYFLRTKLEIYVRMEQFLVIIKLLISSAFLVILLLPLFSIKSYINN